MRSKWVSYLVALSVIYIAGCGAGSDQPTVEEPVTEVNWPVVTVESMSDHQLEQLDRCNTALEEMVAQTMAELKEALEEAGPSEGIGVCSIRAPEIAAEISNRHAVLIGRTATKLRNPANIAPDWAHSLIEVSTSDPTYLSGPDGQLAALVPIATKPPCLQCHGGRESMTPDVLAALSELYPNDAAVGFKEGDLRGWFWVEVLPAGPTL
jgi:hypothetical protein